VASRLAAAAPIFLSAKARQAAMKESGIIDWM